MREQTKKFHTNPYVLVIASFLFIILLGSVLLCMPFCRVDNSFGWSSYIDQLFVSVSATCVTGLCSYEDGIIGTLTIPGQIVLALMIQIGGLGFITVLTFLLTLFRQKLQFKDRYIISQAVNSTSIADVVIFVRRIIIISASVEAFGFILGLPVFFTMFPSKPVDALWNSFFMSVSAFNNAGFDLLGKTSLLYESGTLVGGLPTWAYIYFLIYLMVLIILGGISFLVIIDVFSFKKKPSQWRAFTKIIFLMTLLLLVGGFTVFSLSEIAFASNKITFLDAAFQSVTCRTAGFASFDQGNMSLVGKVTSCALMFIGGAPLSTAGGIKITTIYMIALAMISYFRGRRVSSFKRVYSLGMVVKAMSLLLIALIVILLAFLGMYGFEYTQGFKSEDIAFEVFSAFGTTGLSTGITTSLSFGSKIILVVLMFLGRLGPMTFFQLFQSSMTKEASTHYQYVEEDFLIG